MFCSNHSLTEHPRCIPYSLDCGVREPGFDLYLVDSDMEVLLWSWWMAAHDASTQDVGAHVSRSCCFSNVRIENRHSAYVLITGAFGQNGLLLSLVCSLSNICQFALLKRRVTLKFVFLYPVSRHHAHPCIRMTVKLPLQQWVMSGPTRWRSKPSFLTPQPSECGVPLWRSVN